MPLSSMTAAAESRIFINGKYLRQRTTGVQRYATQITMSLQQQMPHLKILAPPGSSRSGLENVQITGWFSGWFWEQCWLPLFLLFQSRYLLVNLCNSAPLLTKRQVVTIHDLAFLENKAWFSPGFARWYGFLIPRICKRAKIIITVSEFMKKEIINTLGIAESKIHVVPNVSPVVPVKTENLFDFSYILLTGIFNPRKNADFVLQQLEDVKKRGLHIVGIGGQERIFKHINLRKDEHVHILDHVSDQHYYGLLKGASAIVYPSLYEGFGIPVLEGLLLGRKVIVPDIQVYRESFGNLPVYYSPDDVLSFLTALDSQYEPISEEDKENLLRRYSKIRSAEILKSLIDKYA